MAQRGFACVIVLLVTYLTSCSAHGTLCWPYPRVKPGDIQNGWTDARQKYNFSPTSPICHGYPQGTVLTPVLRGNSSIRLQYVLTMTHGGNCRVEMLKNGQWLVVARDEGCGRQLPPYVGQVDVAIPAGNYRAVLRWVYEADNGVGEIFDACSDVLVSAGGSNAHVENACDRVPYSVQLQQNLVTNSWPLPCLNGATVCKSGFDKVVHRCVDQFWYPLDCMAGSKCVSVGDGKAACK